MPQHTTTYRLNDHRINARYKPGTFKLTFKQTDYDYHTPTLRALLEDMERLHTTTETTGEKVTYRDNPKENIKKIGNNEFDLNVYSDQFRYYWSQALKQRYDTIHQYAKLSLQTYFAQEMANSPEDKIKNFKKEVTKTFHTKLVEHVDEKGLNSQNAPQLSMHLVEELVKKKGEITPFVTLFKNNTKDKKDEQLNTLIESYIQTMTKENTPYCQNTYQPIITLQENGTLQLQRDSAAALLGLKEFSLEKQNDYDIFETIKEEFTNVTTLRNELLGSTNHTKLKELKEAIKKQLIDQNHVTLCNQRNDHEADFHTQSDPDKKTKIRKDWIDHYASMTDQKHFDESRNEDAPNFSYYGGIAGAILRRQQTFGLWAKDILVSKDGVSMVDPFSVIGLGYFPLVADGVQCLDYSKRHDDEPPYNGILASYHRIAKTVQHIHNDPLNMAPHAQKSTLITFAIVYYNLRQSAIKERELFRLNNEKTSIPYLKEIKKWLINNKLTGNFDQIDRIMALKLIRKRIDWLQEAFFLEDFDRLKDDQGKDIGTLTSLEKTALSHLKKDIYSKKVTIYYSLWERFYRFCEWCRTTWKKFTIPIINKKISIKMGYILGFVAVVSFLICTDMGIPNPLNPFGNWFHITFIPWPITITLSFVTGLLAYLAFKWKGDRSTISTTEGEMRVIANYVSSKEFENSHLKNCNHQRTTLNELLPKLSSVDPVEKSQNDENPAPDAPDAP